MSAIEYINSVVLTSTQDPISFTSIPQTYNDLIFVANYTDSANQLGQMTFNSDSGTNYSSTLMYGNGTATASSRRSTYSAINISGDGYVISGWGSPGTVANIMEVHILSYSNTSIFKTVICTDGGASGGAVSVTTGLWRSTAAINTITLTNASTGVWASGSIFTLWGIK